MFDIVKKLRGSGIGVAILKDQTNWLDELNERYDFFKLFDVIYNSYHLGKARLTLPILPILFLRLGSAPEKPFCRRYRSALRNCRNAGIHDPL